LQPRGRVTNSLKFRSAGKELVEVRKHYFKCLAEAMWVSSEYIFSSFLERFLSDNGKSSWVFTCDGPGCLWEKRDSFRINRLEWHTSWKHLSEFLSLCTGVWWPEWG